MQNKKNNKEYKISVPVYSYTKKVLQKQFGENLNNATLQNEFFIAAGNLYAPMFQVKPPISSNNISRVELLEIETSLSSATISLLSLYDKQTIAYSLATVLNKEAANILQAVILFNFSKTETKTKTSKEVFDYFDISEDDLNFRKYVEKYYSKYNKD